MNNETNQPELITGSKSSRIRKPRKTRDDKGKRRRVDPTERETALGYFASLDQEEKQTFITHCELIMKYCGTGPKSQKPAAALALQDAAADDQTETTSEE